MVDPGKEHRSGIVINGVRLGVVTALMTGAHVPVDVTPSQHEQRIAQRILARLSICRSKGYKPNTIQPMVWRWIVAEAEAVKPQPLPDEGAVGT